MHGETGHAKPASSHNKGAGRIEGSFGQAGAGLGPWQACLVYCRRSGLVGGLLAFAGRGLGGTRLLSRNDALRRCGLMACRFGSRRGCRCRREDRRSDHHRGCETKTYKRTEICHILHSMESAGSADERFRMSRRRRGREGAGGWPRLGRLPSMSGDPTGAWPRHDNIVIFAPASRRIHRPIFGSEAEMR